MGFALSGHYRQDRNGEQFRVPHLSWVGGGGGVLVVILSNGPDERWRRRRRNREK